MAPVINKSHAKNKNTPFEHPQAKFFFVLLYPLNIFLQKSAIFYITKITFIYTNSNRKIMRFLG